MDRVEDDLEVTGTDKQMSIAAGGEPGLLWSSLSESFEKTWEYGTLRLY